MRAIGSELIKLKRSLAWPVVLGLPTLLALSGAATRLSRGEAPADGWHTVWLQSVAFYGLFPMAIGVAILGSLIWRVEHRGGAWNALMAGPTSSRHIVVAKTAVLAGLTAMMQLVLVVATVLVGRFGFGLPGMLPTRYLVVTALLMLASVPLAALQSALSMLLRSFAGPVGVALVGAGISTVALMAVGDAALISPYALATRAALLGTGTFGDDGSVGAIEVAVLAGIGGVLSLGVVAAASAALDRRDVRA